MSSSYSPIDESSFTDTTFDAEAMLNGLDMSPRGGQSSQYNETQNPASNQGQTGYAPVNTAAPGAASMPQQQQQGTAAPRVEKEKKVKTGPSALSRLFRLIRDSRTVMFIGLIFVVFAGYSLIVSISYFAHIGSDQSAMLNSDFDPSMIRNAGGPFGAWIAHNLLYNWLGVGSFILIYYLAVCGLSMLKVYRPPFWSLTLRCLLTAVALSVICGLITYEFASPIFWGGRHGHLLNENLFIYTGFWGALGLSIIMGGLVVVLYLAELRRVIGVASDGINSYRERQAERRAERERIRQAEEEERMKREAEVAAAKAAEEAAARAAKEQRREAEMLAAEQKRLAAERQAAQEARNEAKAVVNEPVVPVSPANTVSEQISDEEKAEEEPADKDTEIKKEDNDFIAPLFSNDEADDDDESVDEGELSLFSQEDQDEAEDESVDEDEPEMAKSPVSTPTAEEVLASEPFDPRAELSNFKFPSVELLRPANDKGVTVDTQEMEDNKRRITETLNHYGIPISHIDATVGPTVTLYEIIPAEGVRIAKIKRLEDDIALSLAALGIRIIAPIPGKGTIGIEVPNKDPQTVSMRSIIESDVYKASHMELPMAMGRTISNDVFMADLCKMPHLLVAGATGMGKSVGLNAIITSLLYKKHPSELKFVLIDPKMVEFSLYASLERHYLAKLPDEEDAIITDPSKVVATLNSLCVEMDNRYALLKEASMRNIKEYNDKFIHRYLNPEKGHRFLPYIVVVVDEFADLIMTAGKEVETPIARIAQKARAVGIHMILATQRPSTNVITGVIKANFPGRIAFRVFQMVDSRTIIDRPGANQLIGRGDMLFSNNGKLDRVQCAFIDTPEVSAICDSIKEQPGYPCAYELPEYIADNGDGNKIATVGDRDPLFDECARLVVTTDTASTSSLQRRYNIGYNRAGRIMDQMEAAGIVGPSQGGKPRQVLVDSLTLERILENN